MPAFTTSPDPDLIAIFFVLAFWGLLIGGIVFFVRFWARRKPVGHAPKAPGERLRKLDDLRNVGSISDSEYQEQRRRILSEI